MKRRSMQPSLLDADPASDWCQRTRDRRTYYRSIHEAGAAIEPALYHVDTITRAQAGSWLGKHHYLRTLPPNKYLYGLSRQDNLVGVAVFGPGMPAVLSSVFPDLMRRDPDAGQQLSRFGLLDDVPAFGETWFLARCFDLLQRDGVAAVVSFSDPTPRVDPITGDVWSPGHRGTIYQASSAIYTGMSKARWMQQRTDSPLLLHPRGLTKYRKRDRSSAHVERDLAASGAPRRRPDETATAYLKRVVEVSTIRVWHPGNYRYAFAIGKSRAGRIARPGLPYPKNLLEVA